MVLTKKGLRLTSFIRCFGYLVRPPWDSRHISVLMLSYCWLNVRLDDDLLRKYMYFDRTRTFGPEWKIAQLWAALDVSHRMLIPRRAYFEALSLGCSWWRFPRHQFCFYAAPRRLGCYLPKPSEYREDFENHISMVTISGLPVHLAWWSILQWPQWWLLFSAAFSPIQRWRRRIHHP